MPEDAPLFIDESELERQQSVEIQTISEHVHTTDCEHYQADVHIDTHEHGHVHGPDCGHVGHEQAHEHVDKHVHSADCGHLHHHVVDSHIDKTAVAINHHEGHNHDEHMHRPGCGHVDHEQASAHIDYESPALTTASAQADINLAQQVEQAQQLLVTHKESSTEPDEAVFVSQPQRPDKHKKSSQATEPLIKLSKIATPAKLLSQANEDSGETSVLPVSTETTSSAVVIEQPGLVELVVETVTDNAIQAAAVLSELPAIHTPGIDTYQFKADSDPQILDVIPTSETTIELSPALETDIQQPGEIITITTPEIHNDEPMTLIVLTKHIAEVFRQDSDAPEHRADIQKEVTALIKTYTTAVKNSPEMVVDKLNAQFIHLLALLGYTDPAQTYADYLRQYGVEFINEMLDRLLELLGYGRQLETIVSQTPLKSMRVHPRFINLGKFLVTMLSKPQTVAA